MILSGMMMLEYLSDKHQVPELLYAAQKLDRAVEASYGTEKLLPYELGVSSMLEKKLML